MARKTGKGRPRIRPIVNARKWLSILSVAAAVIFVVLGCEQNKNRHPVDKIDEKAQSADHE